MSHVEFKKWPCRPVNFRGLGPFYCQPRGYVIKPHVTRLGILLHFNVMQYSNTALETITLVMHDSDTFFNGVPLFLMALRLS